MKVFRRHSHLAEHGFTITHRIVIVEAVSSSSTWRCVSSLSSESESEFNECIASGHMQFQVAGDLRVPNSGCAHVSHHRTRTRTETTQSLGKNVLVSSEDRHQKHLSLCCDVTSSSSTAVLRSMFDPHEKLTLQTKRGKPAKTSIKRSHLHGWHFEHTQNTPETCLRRHAILLWILLLRCGRNPSQVNRRRKRFRWRHKLNTISLQ